MWTFCSQSKRLLYRSWCICKLIKLFQKLTRKWQIAIYFRPTMPPKKLFSFASHMCIQNVPVKSNSVYVNLSKKIDISYIRFESMPPISGYHIILFNNELTYIYIYIYIYIYQYISICIVLYVWYLYVFHCVLFFSVSFVLWLVKPLSCLVMPIKNLNLNLIP